METTKEVVGKLNDLLTKNYDAEAGYKKAAEEVDNPGLKNFLKRRAEQRYQFGHQIKAEIGQLGGSPDKGTSIKGDVHRTWMTLKNALSSGNESLFEECVRGEKTTVEEYKEVLSDTSLPKSTRETLISQQNNIQNALQDVKTLEDLADLD